jgi:hypothetical protein
MAQTGLKFREKSILFSDPGFAACTITKLYKDTHLNS